jgi:hypothetical protein
MSFALLVAILAGQVPKWDEYRPWDEFRPWTGDQCITSSNSEVPPLITNLKFTSISFGVKYTWEPPELRLGDILGWKDLQDVARLRQEYDAERAKVIGDAKKLAALREKQVTEFSTRSHAESVPSLTRGVCLASGHFLRFNEAGQPKPKEEGPLPQGVMLVEITEGRLKGRCLWISRENVWSLKPHPLPNLGDEPEKPAEEKQKDVGASPSQRAPSR